ncbi:hypothetical protein PHLCEN_2v8849 [Hermanssonia centrifuga]|uniref:NAD(P)-binding protein n=1 Tax=Hermanssonia centrifuga TaxID=98765 RepID=A0A2R6NSN4_9APHY|nr:hypothetical protein PHLCEN_2v8849 [Hermanssonia centrifuga]
MNDAKCVLVVGATAGIGRALALAIHDLPSKPTVIVAGRRQERLDELCPKSERIKGVQVDVTGGKDSLKEFSTHVTTHYPELDAVIFSSGIQHLFKLEEPETIDLDLFETELVTNYTSVITMITYFLPQFLKLSEKGRPSFIVPITSVLGIVPGPWVPYYSATKAALHSLSLSLHTQLKDTQVNVMEIFPPLVESELHDRKFKLPIFND